MGVGFFRPSRAGFFNGVYPRLAPWAAFLRRFAAGGGLGFPTSRAKCAREMGHPSALPRLVVLMAFYPRLAPWAAFLRRFAAGGGLGFPTSRAKCAREMGHPALPGLVFLMAFTHGLRRGLHSCAALRLEVGWAFPLLAQSAREKWGTRRLWIRGFPPFPQRARKEWGTRHPSFMCHLHLQRWNG